ncbi:MAG: PAS domain S-box protein [Dehalococcoidales bacterium]|jgi:PAS domain S-box-containing protein|nr:PAS domain S-box protein [Dehalococcoidales bacterium]
MYDPCGSIQYPGDKRATEHGGQQMDDFHLFLFENAPIGYLAIDEKYIINDTNLTFARMLSQEKQDLIGKKLTTFISRNTRRKFYSRIKQAFATGIPQKCELTLLKPDQTQFQVLLQGSTLQFKENYPHTCHVAVMDISRYVALKNRLAITNRTLKNLLAEHEKTNNLLKETLQFNTALLENAPYPIVVTGTDTSVVYVNNAFENLTGFSRSELLGKKSPYPWWPDDKTQQYESENLPGRSLETNILERKHRKKNGENIWVLIHIRSVKDEWGQPRYYIANWVDITERKRVEEQIRQSQERLNRLFNLMAEGAILWDSSLRIIDANSEAARIFGLPREHLLNQPYEFEKWTIKPAFEHIRPDGTTMPYEELAAHRACKEKREVRNIEFGHKWADGKITWINTSAVPILDPAGNIDCVLCTFADITEQKRLRDELEYYLAQITRAQEKERKRISRELHDDTAQFLALACLEIDAVITHGKQLSAETLEKLTNLKTMVSRTLQVIRRFSHELHPSVLEHFGLVPALELIIGEFNESCETEVRFNLTGKERRLPDEVELALFRITQESLNNIRKHAQAKSAYVNLHFAPAKVKLVIADNGRGFDLGNEEQNAIRKGSLGIVSMKERAMLIGAHFKIDSAPGKGTVIKVEYSKDK